MKSNYSPESEQAILAHVLRHPCDFLSLYDVTKPTDFFWKPFGWAWEAMYSLNASNTTIDTVTVGDELERNKQLAEFSLPMEQIENLDKVIQFHGRAALSQLRDVHTTGNGLDYADIVKDYAHKRTITNIMSEGANWAANGRHAKDIVSDLQSRLEGLNIHSRASRAVSVSEIADAVESDTRERAKDPQDVWGIPYAWPYLSLLTGGKQPDELTIIAGEPKAGKTWFVDQDALETAIAGTPVYMWSGELGKKQTTRRLYQLLGVDSRRMRSGNMRQEDWEILEKAKETLKNIPLYIDDTPLSLGDISSVLSREQSCHGIKQVVLDYSLLIQKAGKDEIERSGNVSREMKIACHDLSLSGILIASVNKMGMDSTGEAVTKSNIRGSGQQIHDCDNLLILTKYSPNNSDPDSLYIKPDRYDSIVSLHIAAGRDLDYHLPGGIINYERIAGTPRFSELKDVNSFPNWIEKAADKMNEREDLK